MDVSRVKAEIFESHYNDIKKKLGAHDYAGARKSTILAAKCMYEQARCSSGATRDVSLGYANSLYANIFTLDGIIESEKRKKKNGSQKKLPEDQVMGNKSSNSDTDEKKLFEAIPVPDISFDDVVGLEDVKDAVRRKIIEPRKNPELYKKYKIKTGGGILMYGPPGTGKTMIAKAIAHEVNAEFFSLRCSELVSKYFGGTEQNIGQLFETARSKKNAVIFFDEFEALAIGRDRNNSTVMKRVVPELLTQMQGIKDSDDSTLLIVAATNMPWMIDSAFMRPGRFDERIYVGLPDDEARRGIISHNLTGVPCSESIDYSALVEHTAGFNCADIVQFVDKAKTSALDRERETGAVGITMEDFNEAIKTSRSSVMRSDIEKMMAWKRENGGE